jgi:hypothetical protein
MTFKDSVRSLRCFERFVRLCSCFRVRGRSAFRFRYGDMGSFLEKPITTKTTLVYEERAKDFIAASSEMQGWRIDMEVRALHCCALHSFTCMAVF